jgi:hypothetical protein
MFYNRFKKMILMLNQISKEFKTKLYKYILLTQIIYLNLSFQKEFQIELNFFMILINYIYNYLMLTE